MLDSIQKPQSQSLVFTGCNADTHGKYRATLRKDFVHFSNEAGELVLAMTFDTLELITSQLKKQRERTQ